jgi:hypothetical protein
MTFLGLFFGLNGYIEAWIRTAHGFLNFKYTYSILDSHFKF